ncbi:unnamed protein product, partial [Prorocentrum cordatum]
DTSRTVYFAMASGSGSASGTREVHPFDGSRMAPRSNESFTLSGSVADDLPEIGDALMVNMSPPKDNFKRLGSSREHFSREDISPAAGAVAPKDEGSVGAPEDAPMGGGEGAAVGEEQVAVAEGAEETDADRHAGTIKAEFKAMGMKMVEMLAHTSVAPPPLAMGAMAMPVDPVDARAEGDDGENASAAAEPEHEPMLDGEHGGLLDDDDRRVSPLSVAEPLPAGAAFANFNRIRATVNSYADKMCSPTWFADIVLGTIHSLARRLENRGEADILNKAPYDVQAAYKQLMVRVKAVIELHKGIKQWGEASDDRALDSMLTPLSVLLGYHLTVNGFMNDELNITFAYAIFRGMAAQQGSVSAAVRLFDAGTLQHMVALRELIISTCVKTETATSEAVVKVEDTASAAAEPPQKKPKRKRATLDTQGKVVKGQTALYYLSTMVSDNIRSWLGGLSEADVRDTAKANSIINELSEIVKFWSEKEKQIETSVEDDTFAEVLKSALVVARCAYTMEKVRPSTALARKARRAIAEQVKQPSTPASELARSMCAYPAPKFLMESSRLHVNQSIEDETATTNFKTCSDSFESHFSALFDDPQGWKISALHNIADKAMDGCGMDLVFFFGGIGPFFTGAWAALSTWTSACAQENVSFFVENLANSFEILEVAKYMITEVYWACVGSTSGRMGNLLMETIMGSEPQESESAESKQERQREIDQELELYNTRLNKLLATLPRFADALKDYYDRYLKCRNLAIQRMGDIFISELGEDHKTTNPITYEVELTHVKTVITDMAVYQKHCMDLAGARADFSTATGREEFTNIIIKLAGLQRFMDGEHWSNKLEQSVDCVVADKDRVNSIGATFCEFKDVAGSQIYTACSDRFVAERMVDIAPSLTFAIVSVSEDVVAEGNGDAAFGKLVTASTPMEDLFHPGVTFVDGGRADEEALQASTHYKALSDLVAFLEASGLASFSISGVSTSDGDKRLPADAAVSYLKMITNVKDVTAIAAVAHHNVFVNIKGAKDLNDTDIARVFGPFVHAQTLLAKALVRIHDLMSSKEIHSLECLGFAAPFTVQSVRQWAKGMSVLSGFCRAELLKRLADIVMKDAAECKKTLPDWSAVMDQQTGALNEKLATKQFNNLEKIVEWYNTIHKHLRWLSRAGVLMELTPSIQHHDLTSESVAVAMACMGKTKQVITMTKGIMMLAGLRQDPGGPKRARDFVAENKAKSPDIPKGFWDELETVAAEGGGADDTASVAGKSAKATSVQQTPPPKNAATTEGASSATKSKQEDGTGASAGAPEVGGGGGGSDAAAEQPAEPVKPKRAKGLKRTKCEQ